MRIAITSPFEEPVPPEKYGGTELVVSNLAETLVALGHEVHLIASGDSQTKAKLYSVFPGALRKDPRMTDLKLREKVKLEGIEKVLQILDGLSVDVIHNHIGWRFLPYCSQLSAPTVTTLHGPLNIERQREVYSKFSDHPYISISLSQRRPMPELNFIYNVYNGIDLDLFNFYEGKGEYLAFLGRMSSEKGPRQAIEIAKKFGMKLKMAAKVDTVDKEYFEKEIEPLIDGERIEYVSEIGPEEKSRFLGGAYALLAPIQWHEPFGLFMTEAMACGTPVVVTKMGSAEEVVSDGETGFVLENNIYEFVSALKKIDNIDRKKCRERVAKLFSKETMTENYLRAYRKVI